jgi:hypothetical protein
MLLGNNITHLKRKILLYNQKGKGKENEVDFEFLV